ncbi:MAG: heme-binding domain-containing protein [Bacteroidales bacterium]|nr:heme-binding domain-containing protein [Bacteroidales bacterium]
MKKIHLFAVSLVVFLALIITVSFRTDNSGNENNSVINTGSISGDVYKIFENSCLECHSAGGKKLASAKLNFSEWDSYKPERQINKSEGICKVITEGNMPPKKFRKSNPESIPTEAQLETICKWSESLAKSE